MLSLSNQRGRAFRTGRGTLGVASGRLRTTTRCRAAPAATLAEHKPPKWTPLIHLVVEMAWDFWEERPEAPAVVKGPHLLYDLHQQPQLYQYLQNKLRTYKIRTVVGTQTRDQARGISYVDPRCPDSIWHVDHAAVAHGSGAEPVLMTCAEAITRHGVELQHPRLPCIAVLHPPCKHKEQAQDRYRTFPLECCWADTIKTNTITEDEEWPMTPGPGGTKCRMPSWIAECFDTSGAPSSGPSNIEAALAGVSGRAAMSRPPSSGDNQREVHEQTGVEEGVLSSVDSMGSTTSHSSSSSRSSISSISSSSSRAGLDRLVPGFSQWTNSLLPTKEEEQHMHATISAVCQVLQDACRGHVWNVVSVLPGGSFKKSTSLRHSHDLDIQVELQAGAGGGRFEAACRECLNAICTQLCRSSPAETDAAQPTHWGWQLGAVPGHYLRLHHPVLNLQLDVQISRSLHQLGLPASNHSEQRKQLLDIMIQRAKAEQGYIDPPPTIPSTSSLLEQLTCPSSDSRQRAAIMAPLLTELVRGVNSRCEREYGLQGAGSMVTTVIRACKAWAKFGLAEQLDSHRPSHVSSRGSDDGEHAGIGNAATSAAAASRVLRAAEPTARPQGYVWEVLVIYVLNQQLQECKQSNTSAAAVYSRGGIREITLFLDVLKAAAALLRPASPVGQEQVCPIPLHEWYTAEECELFRGAWGPPGQLYTPFTIHPADPSYNCTAHSSFKNWSVIADEAGSLHNKLQMLVEQLAVGADGPGDSSVSRSCDSPDIWQRVLDTTTLGPAVRAFAADGDDQTAM